MKPKAYPSFVIRHLTVTACGIALVASLTLLTTAPHASAQTIWSNALSFSGGNDSVAIINFGYAVPTNEVTVEFWQRVHRPKAQSTFGLNPDNPNNHFLAHVPYSDGVVYWDFGDITTVGRLSYTPRVSLTNSWHHFALVARAGAGGWMAIYRDGLLETSKAGAGSPFFTNQFLILGGGFDGELDDLRIWKVARTQAEIRADMSHPLIGTESNLVAYWKFDEVGGSGAYDSTTNGYHGLLLNNPVRTNSTIPQFLNINAGLPGVVEGSVAWGDLNNDGRLDIFLTGATNLGLRIAQVWTNTGSGFVRISTALPGVSQSSVAWGDYNNDGRLDILITGTTDGNTSGAIAEVWRNTGSGFVKVNTALPGVMGGSVAWGDYNNDGRLDILLTGYSASGGIARVYRNNGDDTFTLINTGLPGVEVSSVAWGDYDNDGWLDILLTGYSVSGDIARVYRNNGDGSFTDINAGLQAVEQGSVAWGDYDNDGRLDILLTGYPVIAQVWRNTGSGFVNINAELTGVRWCSAGWGDYDNDGRLDILLTGAGQDNYIGQVWRNNGDGTFSDSNSGLPGVIDSSVAWGDFNNDGRLDFLLTGRTNIFTSSSLAQVWQNNAPLANTPPAAPTGLTAAEGNFSWSPATDAQTPAGGLTYNLRVGTNSGGSNVVSPQAALDGFRRLPALGNAQQGLTALAELSWGDFYWSVQAVDTAFAGSAFASEQHFVIAAKTLPATEVALTTARLNGTVHPLGRPTAAWFEWGANTSYGQRTPVLLQNSGNSPMPISHALSGLVLHTYHYRAVASNELGLHVGADKTIALQLALPQLTATLMNLTPTTATLRGTVNPMERETFAWFEYGLTTKYGSALPANNFGSGHDSLSFTSTVSGLLPRMTFHFRAVATNSVGRTNSADLIFVMPEPSQTAPAISALPDVTLPQGSNTLVGFAVSDPDTPLSQLKVQVRCNNPVLMPDNSIQLGGFEGNRGLTLSPAPDQSGSAAVTVTVSDEFSAISDTFMVTVQPRFDSALLYLTNAHLASAEAWRFRFVDAGTGSTNYAVEYRADLSPTNAWIPATNLIDRGGGEFEVATGPSRLGFYRIKGLRLLTAGLGTADLTVDEGAGFAGPVILFNGPYVGTVRYSWIGVSGSSTGMVQVAGTTAVIPIPLTNNLSIDQLQSLTLRLETESGYSLGAPRENRVTIEENDAEWQGALIIPNGIVGSATASLTNLSGGYTNVSLPQNGQTIIDFTLKIQQSGASLQGALRSASAGFFPTNETLAQVTLTADAFSAVALHVPLPALTNSALFSASHYLNVRLDAVNNPGQTNVSSARISGLANLVSVVPGRPYLDSALSGTFLLFKPPVRPSTNEVPFYLAP